MNYDRIYEFRFKEIDDRKKKLIWSEVSDFIASELGNPKSILDPAAGKCEFINAVVCSEKWAIDLNEYFIKRYANPDVKVVVSDVLTAKLPSNHFDAVFISNFLEHLHSQEEVAQLLTQMYECLKPGGRIAVMGPNFKHTYREYFDFADHTVILTELGLVEHLYGAGFSIKKCYSKFLPLSFRGRLPVNKFLTILYLKMPFFWNFFGKQFLVIGQKKTTE